MASKNNKYTKKFDLAGLEKKLKSRIEGEVRFDNTTKAIYSTDASNYRQIPLGVVIPKSIDDVERAMAVCREFGAPVVSRGGGTGLCGQACNVAVVFDFSKYLNRILEIDPDKKTARVQPGLILDDLRDEAEKKYQLTFGPDPATHNHCTFGGMLGNDSCGIHSIMAGRTADNVYELEILTYDGLRMRVGPTPDNELSNIISRGGRKGEIYGNLKNVRDRYAELIRSRYPKIPRRVSGYNLDNLLPESGFNVARALVGSEGTCVTILEATIRLIYSPPERVLLVLGYPDVYSAADHIPEIMEQGPIGCEGIDDLLVEYMRKKGMHKGASKFLPEGKGWVLVQFGGATKDEADERARKAMERLRQSSNPPSMKLYDDKEEEEMVWEIRESGLGATANVPGLPLSWPGWEDAALPPEKVGQYLREFRALLNEFGYQAALYGHFGQGCVHCRITFDLFTHEGVKKYMGFIDKASSLVVKYGGSFSAEHGDGQSKAIFLSKMYGPELMDAFRQFKRTWDPEWKMNPGKVIDPYLPDQNLKIGVSYSPLQPETYFKFPEDDGNISRASLRCVGVGKCRRTHDAFMCPSFLATREELHTTRGRARAIFEMLRGDFITSGWKSKEVREALELCLGCKGCKKQCPVNVDMDTYKAEFLSHYYKGRLRPLSHYSMGLVEYWSMLADRAPRLANLITHFPVLSSIIKLMGGIAPERQMPRYARMPFSRWYRKYGRSKYGIANPKGEPVLLVPDLFNDVFYPRTLASALDILIRWGFRVVVPEKRPASIRPLLHTGMLRLAKSRLQKNISHLRSYAAEGMPMIFLEPSTASVYKTELPALFPHDADGNRITGLSYLLSEFIHERDLEVPQFLPSFQVKAIFHAHCHQKAVLKPDAARSILSKMGIDYEEPQQGCCGMAGSFGMERKHYDVSMKIGQEHLLPSAQKADARTLIIADGFSCRSQILDGTGRMPLHIAELTLLAFIAREKEVPSGSRTLDRIRQLEEAVRS